MLHAGFLAFLHPCSDNTIHVNNTISHLDALPPAWQGLAINGRTLALCACEGDQRPGVEA